jgi:hypothetical protein
MEDKSLASMYKMAHTSAQYAQPGKFDPDVARLVRTDAA